MGLVRDERKPLATRFELRSPNPKSNTYLVLAAAIWRCSTASEAPSERRKRRRSWKNRFSKKVGEEDFYLETDRQYRSEKDVFEDYTEEERSARFGRAPATVWENIQGFVRYPEKVAAILRRRQDLFAGFNRVLRSLCVNQWKTELHNRVIPDYMRDIREYTRYHGDDATDYDIDNWAKINELKFEIAKSSLSKRAFWPEPRRRSTKAASRRLPTFSWSWPPRCLSCAACTASTERICFKSLRA